MVLSERLPKLLVWEFLFAKAIIKTFRDAKKIAFVKNSFLLTEMFNY